MITNRRIRGGDRIFPEGATDIKWSKNSGSCSVKQKKNHFEVRGTAPWIHPCGGFYRVAVEID